MLPKNILQLINQPTFDPRLRDRINEWEQIPSFVKFIQQNDKKILKLLKTRKENEDKRDIGIEVFVGSVFTKVNCQVIYEPDLPIPHKPDFKISFKGNRFFCEVKRIRKDIFEDISIEERGKYINEEMYKKCGDVICEKIVQTVPNEINVIYIRIKLLYPELWDLKTAVKELFEWKKADPKGFLRKIKRNKINSINEFDQYWKQLSAIVIKKRIWENPDAIKPLNSKIKTKIEEVIPTPFRYDNF